MTIRQIAQQLRSQGHVVQYYVRKDGGVLIKEIDGQKYSGALGNLTARAMVGEKISTKRAGQLWKITYTGKRAEATLPDREIKNLLHKVQRKWRKAFYKGTGEIPPQGRKTQAKVAWNIKYKGREEAIRLLKEAEKYASGIAYTENIAHLADYTNTAGQHLNNQALMDLAQDIKTYGFMIKESSIQPAYKELYKLNKMQVLNLTPDAIASNVRRILELP